MRFTGIALKLIIENIFKKSQLEVKKWRNVQNVEKI